VLTPASDPEPGSSRPAEEQRTARTDAKAAPGATPGLTDANIAAIVVAANNADIAYAEQALAKSRDADVRRFATMVKKDHEAMNTAATQLATRLKLVPADNEASFDLRDDAEEKRERFRELEDFAFDSAYAHNEVTYHRNVLKAIDEALIPSARNAELKALLIQVRPAVAAHADHAEALAARKGTRPR
jgi:putative membrane protein